MQSPFLSVYKEDKNEGKVLCWAVFTTEPTAVPFHAQMFRVVLQCIFKEGEEKKLYSFFVVADFFPLLKQWDM